MKAILLLCVTTLHAVVGSSGHEWWRTMSLYQVYPRSYKDSNGDGLGDIKGIISKLDHMTESHIDAFWVSPFYSSPMVDFGYDISDYRSIFPAFGTMKDFEDMVKAAHSKNLKVVIDFVPNHTSDQHEWFQKSLKNIKPYSDYYVWHEGRKLENGTRAPPNNWISIFGGSAWTWRPERNAYYYHQYTKEQPDVNYFNEDLVQEMKDILKFWLDKGIDGIRVDAAARLCENQTFADEPLSGLTNDPNNFAYTVKIYTRDHPRNYEIVRGWSKVLAQYEGDKVMMIEAYTDLNHTMEFYDAGASYPFNFAMVINLNSNSTAKDWKFIVDRWIDNMPKGATPNWVAGNHDNSRLVTRLGPDRARAITAMTFILPGVTVTYNGDEIGMEDTWVSYKNTQDPHGCNEGPEGYEKTSRDPVRSPFQWDATTSAGFSTNAKTWIPVNDDYKTVNLASEKKDKDSFYNFYNSLAILKKVNPAVRKGNLTDKLLTDNVLYIARETVSQGAVYAILNVANSTEVVDLSEIQKPKCKLRVYYASAGFGLKKGALLCNESVKVPPYGTLVLTRH
ncbi:alpha-glucosidase [Megalopta genalis]|uniref:alpha-glucosidase n=1 Tax=Megalopta genalis TaxID=115081 RepID=UPI001443125F|nr:alpha-glucosidase-like [Megalopta genalis]